PSKYRCKHYDKNHKDQQHKDEQVGILGPKDSSKDDKLIFKKIQQKKGLSIDLDEWTGKQDCQKQVRQVGPPVVIFPLGFARIDPYSFPIFYNRPNRLSKPIDLDEWTCTQDCQ